MRRTGNDQTVVLCGESGSGKTHIRNLVVNHLMRLSVNKRLSKSHNQIMNGQEVLRIFGSAKTDVNKNASRVGVYTEIHFNGRGRIVGAKSLHYFLEKTRISGKKLHEGNFNVFYMLLGGTTPDEKQVLLLKDNPDAFRYLSNYGRPLHQEQDGAGFIELKQMMRIAGFRRDHVSRIIQLLAAILHLGNLEFADATGTGTEESVTIKNEDTLELAADFLGLNPVALANVLKFKTALIGNDVTTLIMESKQAAEQRDNLAQTLYSLLFSWMVEYLNKKTCTDDFNCFIGILDFPGTRNTFSAVGFDQFCIDYANEKMYSFLNHRLFESDIPELQEESIELPEISFNNNSACMELLDRALKGICTIINKMSEKNTSGKRDFSDLNLLQAISRYHSENPMYENNLTSKGVQQFSIQHFSAKVNYDPTGFLLQNNNQLLVDFVTLFRGDASLPPSWNTFVLELFSDENLAIDNHPIHSVSSMLDIQQTAKPMRLPSMRKSQRKKPSEKEMPNETSQKKNQEKKTVISQIRSALDELLLSFEEATLWTVFCIKPNDTYDTTYIDRRMLQQQIDACNLEGLAKRMRNFYPISMAHTDFLDKYAMSCNLLDLTELSEPKDQCENIIDTCGWTKRQVAVGNTKIFLSYSIWSSLEQQIRNLEKNDKTNDNNTIAETDKASIIDRNPVIYSYHDDDLNTVSENIPVSFYSEGKTSCIDDDGYREGYNLYPESQYTNDSFVAGADVLTPPVNTDLNANDEKESTMTPSRKRWLWFVKGVTFWIPSLFLLKCGRMKRKDVRIAWREKFTLCTMIALLCGFVIWFLVFFGDSICPKQDVFSRNELSSHSSAEDGYVEIRGEVFNLGAFAPHHYPSVVPMASVLTYAGKDASDIFPVQVSDLCENVSPFISTDYQINYTDPNAQYHDFRYATGNYRKNWYYDQMTMLRRNYKVGNMGYENKALSDQAEGGYTLNGQKTNRNWAVINENIYDLTTYMMGGRYLAGPPGVAVPSNIDTNFLDSSVVELFQDNSGTDITAKFEALSLTPDQKNRELACIRNLYFVGLVDHRNSAKCQFSTYFLLAITICLCLVMLFKFLAALRIGSPRTPEELDKFVICQVTCYTEDEESLKKTIDSLAVLRYDNKRKLIVVICDGMIVGSGNDRPTPRIVLDILGVDPQIDPEPLSFVSVGEGMKQHNRAKIYSGLYEINGHVVPYLVVAKVGAPQELQKPGNRGKRDSQLVLMQFLNRVYFDAPMNPMQLEMYHQMRNVIGVSPELYEYVLMVDADTEVMPTGLNHLVSSMAHDAKIIGLCGETTLANEKDTWVTMIQVYEYFISHHMIKSFESLFSSVSCLPGCFTMYRIRSIDGKKPLFIANEVIDDYVINVVDTLHKKNLLYLGEDRYLTTLLLKHFPKYKTKFNPDAQCKTNAPDTWFVLVSQRRRWINSTVHNLGELVFLPQLCGFCCFSMRFVVMLDLFSTLVQPALLAYLGVLIWKLTEADDQIPYITIITLCCTYGLQIIIFILHRRWEYIAWFFVSILALPIFSFYIPVYAYWHFDDFSWGNTRVVVGEKGKKVTIADEKDFDPKSIPLIRWADYERMILSEHWTDELSQVTPSSGSIISNGLYSNYSHPNINAYTPNYSVSNGGYPIQDYSRSASAANSYSGMYASSVMSGPYHRYPPDNMSASMRYSYHSQH
ncbi:glycosyltransferase family 2 protein [Backusella circina FSU 941]|nr:glycosyltransferase family 2 protein [Backusella circina FSU 941]